LQEASARVLLDRTMIRLDGRSIFSFGVQLYLTPKEKLPAAIQKIAEAGFTAVSTPPASPGNIDHLNSIFDEAEKYDLLVIINVDARVKEPSLFLAQNFAHRRSLHSYCLHTKDDSEKEFLRFCRERDRLRGNDLFHPIWTPYRKGILPRLYIDSTELHAVSHSLGGPVASPSSQDGPQTIKMLFDECKNYGLTGRPFFCQSLRTMVSNKIRKLGVYDFDPNVRFHSPKYEDWYPYYTNIAEENRWDFLPPDPEVMRIKCFELLACRTRGIITGIFDFFEGKPPFSGMDRFHELSIIAREIESLKEFFSEGQYVIGDMETGHPNLQAAMLHHTDEILLLLWRSGKGDEYWIDPSPMVRAEIYLDIESPVDLNAWVLDFPKVKKIPISRDAKGAIKLQIENFDLTGKILMARSTSRIKEIENKVSSLLPKVVRAKQSSLDVRQRKIMMIESELNSNHYGANQRSLVEDAKSLISEAKNLIDIEEYENAWDRLTEAAMAQREIINKQMVQALGNDFRITDSTPIEILRRNYFTLPRYYKEMMQRDEDNIMEYT